MGIGIPVALEHVQHSKDNIKLPIPPNPPLPEGLLILLIEGLLFLPFQPGFYNFQPISYPSI